MNTFLYYATPITALLMFAVVVSTFVLIVSDMVTGMKHSFFERWIPRGGVIGGSLYLVFLVLLVSALALGVAQ